MLGTDGLMKMDHLNLSQVTLSALNDTNYSYN